MDKRLDSRLFTLSRRHTMRTTAQLISMLLALVLIGCTNTTTTQLTPTAVTPPTTTPIVDESPDVAADIAANYQCWQEADIRDYRFSLMVDVVPRGRQIDRHV
jgi:hypothetical protein